MRQKLVRTQRAVADRNVHGEHFVQSDPAVVLLQVLERLEQEPGADQKNEADADLRDDEKPLYAPDRHSGRRARSGKPSEAPRSRSREARQEGEEAGRREADGQRDTEHGGIDGNLGGAGGVACDVGGQKVDTAERQ